MTKLFGNDKSRSDPPVEVLGKDVVDPSQSQLDINDRRYARVGWIIVLVGLLGFGGWAALAPLDQGVPAPGTVMVSGNRQAVQNLVGGVVSDILVREGSKVQEGEVILKLDATRARSEAEALRSQLFSTLAIEARLQAERDGAKALVFPEALLKARTDPRVEMAMLTQTQLFDTRAAALSSELEASSQAIAGLRADIEGLKSVTAARRDQAKLLQEQLVGMRSLAKEGYVARNRVLELERELSRLQGDIAEATSSMVSTQRRIAEVESRMSLRRQEFQREVRTQLSDAQRQVQEIRSRLEYADFEVAHTDIKAPSTGVVVGLKVFTEGGVISSGTQMMEIVPEHEPLMVEARVPVHLIDKLHPGLDIEMMFTAFNQAVTPHIPGVVRTVSADRLVDEQSGEPYYRVEAQVTPQGETLLAENMVRPGMPVDILIKTGERSLLNYLFRPFIDRAKTSFVQQ